MILGVAPLHPEGESGMRKNGSAAGMLSFACFLLRQGSGGQAGEALLHRLFAVRYFLV